jgi:hypothetical protein
MLPLALAAAVAAAPESAAVGAVRGYVSVPGENRLVVVDVEKREVVSRIRVAAGPHDVDATFDGRRVVVTHPRAGRVTIVDGQTPAVLRVISGLGRPHDAEVSTDGRFAYVTEERRGTLAVLDLDAGRVLRRAAVGARPRHLVLHDSIRIAHGPRSRHITVVGCSGAHFSCVDEPGRPRLLARQPAGGAPFDIDHFEAQLFFTYWGSGLVGSLTPTGRIRYRRAVLPAAKHIAFDYYSGRRLWVTGGPAGGAAIVNAWTGRLVRRLRIPGDLGHVAIASERLAGIVRADRGNLILLSRTTGERRAVIHVGRAPHDVAFALLP